MDSHERVRVDSHERAWADGPEQAVAPPRGDVSERRITATGWLDGARIIICFVAILWLIEAINTGLGHAFNVFGIFPREVATLPGILFWPFLHGNFQHLIMNTTPLLALGPLIPRLQGARARDESAHLAGFSSARRCFEETMKTGKCFKTVRKKRRKTKRMPFYSS